MSKDETEPITDCSLSIQRSIPHTPFDFHPILCICLFCCIKSWTFDTNLVWTFENSISIPKCLGSYFSVRGSKDTQACLSLEEKRPLFLSWLICSCGLAIYTLLFSSTDSPTFPFLRPFEILIWRDYTFINLKNNSLFCCFKMWSGFIDMDKTSL